ncbi:NYN domain-containing protein [Agrococcus sp. SL85]|uniref:NYN domain-containing protein n=1 Tax=Agrococcus sp. SL85 TaxID=2995141 RepID=UPI00226CA55B|nr:NYN domain-containing protein [Agrococcus sp. SL85]WAC65431.1 NYN domain-containing protein [Agrococcus sp. SL85]
MSRKKLIAYVDGFNLYNGVRDSFAHRYLWLDLVRLMENYRPDSEVVRVNYFSARVLDDSEALSRQDTYIAALEALHPERIAVRLGRYQSKSVACKACGAEWTSYEEKETDVNLALAIARDAIAPEADDYFLLSGDSDAAPAVREAMRLNPSGFYAAFFPPGRHSEELKQLMPASRIIGRDKLRNSQLPETVSDANGSTFEQPAKWKPETFLPEPGTPSPILRAKPDGSMPTPRDMNGHRHT